MSAHFRSPFQSPSRSHFLPAALAAVTAVGILVALASSAITTGWPPAAFWHLVFASGAMPLVFGAMIYFTPVLTRTQEAPRTLMTTPLMALAAGLAIIGWFAHGIEALRDAAPWLGLGAVVGLAYWMRQRKRSCLGPPHPCLAWYLSALLCLALGLIAVGISALWPHLAQPLRAFHLHINTLGFLGLTAIGTLQVLLPTVVGQPDPAAAKRLRRDLPWSLVGAVGIALGAAVWLPLAITAALAYAWPLLRLANDARRTFGARLIGAGHVAPLLLAAISGLALLMLHGIAHGAGITHPRDALPLFLVAFLLPLLSGAVAQLLPVWLKPRAPGDWHKRQRQPLAAFARTRALLLLAAGALAVPGSLAAYPLAMLCALWLIGAMAAVAMRSIRQD